MDWILKNKTKRELTFAPSLDFEYKGEVFILDKGEVYKTLEADYKYWLVIGDDSEYIAKVAKTTGRSGLLKQVYSDGHIEYKLFGDKIVNLGYANGIQKSIDDQSKRHNWSKDFKLKLAIGGEREGKFRSHGHLNKCEVKSL